MAHNERVPFRLIQCPVCDHLICWVNARLPSYCPEGGHFIYDKVHGGVLVSDPNATLRYTQMSPDPSEKVTIAEKYNVEAPRERREAQSPN